MPIKKTSGKLINRGVTYISIGYPQDYSTDVHNLMSLKIRNVIDSRDVHLLNKLLTICASLNSKYGKKLGTLLLTHGIAINAKMKRL
jgi:hypothetical protein